jgi:DNA-binding response OmpR family regulator
MFLKKVLVVDDEPKITQIVGVYLEKEGYQVFTASTGKEALECAERKALDLIVLDLRLPDLPGEEVCRRIRQRRDTPILMLTANTSSTGRKTSILASNLS